MTSIPRSIDDLLTEARSHLRRLQPQEAPAILQRGGLLVDIRPQWQRAEEGEIEDAVVIERNVMEWRLDPSAPTRLPLVRDHQQSIIVVCSEGYTSSLAAFSLWQLGFSHATDIEGGFLAWKAAGMPTIPGGRPPLP